MPKAEKKKEKEKKNRTWKTKSKELGKFSQKPGSHFKKGKMEEISIREGGLYSSIILNMNN